MHLMALVVYIADMMLLIDKCVDLLILCVIFHALVLGCGATASMLIADKASKICKNFMFFVGKKCRKSAVVL